MADIRPNKRFLEPHKKYLKILGVRLTLISTALVVLAI